MPAPLHMHASSLENLCNGVLMPALTLLLGGNLHGFQESSDTDDGMVKIDSLKL